MSAHAPPKAAGGIISAAHQKLPSTILVATIVQINGAHHQTGWEVEARRLLAEYWRTGQERHLHAFDTHLCAMRLHEVICAE